jgi:hypothetical protein
MSEFEDKPEAFTGSGTAALQEEVSSLRTLLSVSLILMIVFGLSVNIFLLKGISVVGGENTKLEQGVSTFNTPKAIEFWNDLVKYSRTHPDYATVINKFSPALNLTLLGPGGAR